MVVFRTRCLCLAQLNRGAGHTICSSEHHFKQVQPHWFLKPKIASSTLTGTTSESTTQ
jgi:hypothetical protein